MAHFAPDVARAERSAIASGGPDTPLAPAAVSLEARMLALYAEHARRVPIAVAVALSVIAALGHGSVAAPVPWLWLLLCLSIQVMRSRVLLRLDTDHGRSVHHRLSIATWWTLANGIAVAAAAPAFAAAESIERAVASMVMVGLTVGTVSTTLGYRPMMLAYNVPVLGALAAVWAFGPVPEGLPPWAHQAVAVLLILLLWIIVTLGSRSFAMFENAFMMRTELDAMHQRLVALASEAEAANRARSRFLQSASHDLRQPLYALSALNGSLALRPLSERDRTLAKAIGQAVDSLSDELDDLLDISRIEAAQLRVKLEPVDLQTELEALVEGMRESALEKGVQLLLTSTASTLTSADRRCLRRVFRNLLDNAIKFSSDGRVDIVIERRDEEIVARIRNRGPSIPPADRERVFQAFFQGGDVRRHGRIGAGLGLAIAREYAGLTGARIGLSEPTGTETEFWVSLPAIDTASTDS